MVQQGISLGIGHRPRNASQSSPEEKKMAAVRVQDLNQQTIELGIPHLKKKTKGEADVPSSTFQLLLLGFCDVLAPV